MKKRSIITTAIISLFICSANAQEQRGIKVINHTQADSGKTYAIIIGVSHYANLPSLKFADKDAEEFYKFLLPTQKNLNNHIFLFLNEHAKRDFIAAKLYDITDSVKPGDKVYIYFGGHGDIEHLTQTDNCLLLLGESPSKNYLRKSDSYLDMNLFRDFFQNWAAKEVKTFFIGDACHSGSLSGGETGRKNTLLSLQQTWKNEIRMLSCQPDELSLEGPQWGGGRGLFSYYLVAGLEGLADKNKDSVVNFFELQSFVRDSVSLYSEQTQIPSLTGDVKSIVSRYNFMMLNEAKKKINWRKDESIDNNSLAFKGAEEDAIFNTIKDSVSKNQFKDFLTHVKNGALISPKEKSALGIYVQFPETSENRIAKGYMKLTLVSLLQAGFEEMLEYLYNDNFENFDFIKRFQIESNLSACISIIGKNHYLYNKLRARQLFLAACNPSFGIQTGAPITGNLMEKIYEGIDSLKKALQHDSMAPFLYLRIGDYYLFSNQFTEAISAYETYQKLLPKDEFALNKLGLTYYYVKNYQKAAEFFKMALKINPQFYKAQTNLQIVNTKL
jgi:hypothetical protein